MLDYGCCGCWVSYREHHVCPQLWRDRKRLVAIGVWSPAISVPDAAKLLQWACDITAVHRRSHVVLPGRGLKQTKAFISQSVLEAALCDSETFRYLMFSCLDLQVPECLSSFSTIFHSVFRFDFGTTSPPLDDDCHLVMAFPVCHASISVSCVKCETGSGAALHSLRLVRSSGVC